MILKLLLGNSLPGEVCDLLHLVSASSHLEGHPELWNILKLVLEFLKPLEKRFAYVLRVFESLRQELYVFWLHLGLSASDLELRGEVLADALPPTVEFLLGDLELPANIHSFATPEDHLFKLAPLEILEVFDGEFDDVTLRAFGLLQLLLLQ